jgi:hypothetical protein
MKKAGIILIVGLLLVALAGTAIAETVAPKAPVPAPDVSSQEFYQQMYEFCQGPNGMMNRCFGDGNNGAAPQGFGGMGGMMSRMMGW